MAQDGKPPGFEDFDARLKQLRDAKLPPPKEGGASSRKSRNVVLNIAIELVAGIVGGVLIGYGLDRWLDSAPLWMIVFMLLGAAAGMMNAWRYIRRIGSS